MKNPSRRGSMVPPGPVGSFRSIRENILKELDGKMTKVNKSTFNQISEDARARYGAVGENQNLLLNGIQNDDPKMNTSTFYGLNTNNSRRISRLDHPSPQVPSRDPPAKLHLDRAEYSEAEISVTDGKIFRKSALGKSGLAF
jgi:hypothetical protein